MIGENSDDLMRMSSSDESPKEPEEVMKAPTNAKNKRKGKKTVEAISERVCAAVKYVRSSPARLQKFKACVEERKINSKSLVCLDIETRWNSTFSMLKSALVFTKAFKILKTKYLPYTKELRKVGGAPDDEDWDKIASFPPFSSYLL
ncbi:hypothetical protein V6N12_058465 [Hibiscus sabdariffa]|uniref:Uncharacterized protein n=1 Tax=Hibiscus sabdariffa TaxID=183260 RepID=A0ABR2ES73_9ROSI